MKLRCIVYVLISLSFLNNLYPQSNKSEDYEIYSLVLKSRINNFYKQTQESLKSIIIIKQLEENSKRESKVDFSLIDGTDSLEPYMLNYLYLQSDRDSLFIERFKTDLLLRETMAGLSSNFTNHPVIDPTMINLENTKINISVISNSKFIAYFGRNFSHIDKSWSRIKKKYNTSSVFKLSKIFYNQYFASLYVHHSCGGLCGSGDVYVMEKINNRWNIVSVINLSMS